MSDWHSNSGPFDIPEMVNWIPRRVKPWIFILFILIIQFSGGIYMAAASQMVGTQALMQEDILMAGYASLIGMAVNFAVMFRIKFRFSTRTQLLVCCGILVFANIICALTDSIPILVLTCLIAGWFRMQATLAVNSTIQLWITPKRDMSVFFCYVYLVVDCVIQLSGIATIYLSFNSSWEYMQVIMAGMLAFMMILVLILLKPMRGPMFIPLKGIDWTGSVLWGIFMLCFTFICVYGNYFDWWDSREIKIATILGLSCVLINLWRVNILSNPYISWQAIKNWAVWRATAVYIVFFPLLATEHVFEHSYAEHILGFDETNLIDLNWFVFAGIIAGVAFTYYTFALRKWRYKTLALIAFCLAGIYLLWFYFGIDYGVEKEALFVPLFFRGMAAVIISIVFLTSIVQSGLPFEVFPQAVCINGFTGAVMGATLGPAIIGEWLRHTMQRNLALFSSDITDFNTKISHFSLGELIGIVNEQALIVAMKEIYGWLLIICILSILLILVSFSPLKPNAIFPKWKNIRKMMRKQGIIKSPQLL